MAFGQQSSRSGKLYLVQQPIPLSALVTPLPVRGGADLERLFVPLGYLSATLVRSYWKQRVVRRALTDYSSGRANGYREGRTLSNQPNVHTV